MAIRLTKNPYHGINAHFNSLLQNSFGGWATFHGDYITGLKNEVNRALPEGYYDVSEQSLQIEVAENTKRQITRPDVSIYRIGEHKISSGSQSALTPTMEIPAHLVLDSEEYLSAVQIYRVVEKGDARPIARIEVLSPANKPPEHSAYLVMRHKTLTSGIYLIEMDFLHQTRSPFYHVMPDYTQHEADSYPYYLAATDPETDLMRFYGFHVDDPIPTVTIPLSGQDSVMLDSAGAYNITFENDRRAHVELDYSQQPMNFPSYSEDDQQRIKTCIDRIASDHKS